MTSISLTFHSQHVRIDRAAAEVPVFGTDLEYLCSSRALGDVLNLHHLSAEGPDLMSSILWSVAISAVNQQLCFCRH